MCLFGYSFATCSPLKIILFVREFFNTTTHFVLEGVAAWRHRCIFSFDVTFLVACGTVFISGSEFLSYLPSRFVIIFISLVIWRDYRILLILFSKWSDIIVFGSFERKETTWFLTAKLRIWSICWTVLSLCLSFMVES